MTKINVKGAVVSNDDADIYDWLGYDCVSPNQVEDVLNNSNGDVEVCHFNGNIVLVPMAVFKVLGNLDHYFTHSKGDFDYGMRANKAGIKIIQCGEVLGECDVHHY